MSIDVPEQFDLGCYEELNLALEEAQVLAARIAILRTEGADYHDLYEATHREVMAITEMIHAYDEELVFNYSGEGFVPMFDYNIEQYRTAYAYVIGRGKFSTFSLLNPEDIKFVCADDAPDETVEQLYADVAIEDEEVQYIDNNLRVPQSGPNLYMDFEIKKQRDSEMIIGGIAVRGYDLSMFHIMDIARLNIDHIEITSGMTEIPENQIVDVMLDAALSVKASKRETTFRRSSRKQQINYLDNVVEDLNAQLGLHRVQMAVETPLFFVPTPMGRDRRILAVKLKEPNNAEIHIKPLRIDCLDSYGVSQGTKITSNKRLVYSDAGLYLVGTIDEYIATRLNIPSTVIWIPLADKTPSDFIIVSEDSIG